MPQTAYINVINPYGSETTQSIEPDSSLLLGSGLNCRVQLEDPDVCDIHCRIWLTSDGDLYVENWHTDGNTIFNDQPLETSNIWNCGDELKIGSYRIVRVPTSCGLALEAASQETNADSKPADSESVEVDSVAPKLVENVPEEPSKFSYDVNQGDEIDDAFDDFQNDFADDDFSPFIQGSSFGADDEDEVARLQMEVEQLQIELADRDEQLRAMSEQPFSASEGEDNSESERLVGRLEELLTELQSTDERVVSLEELLRVSDEATAAEKEERLQLESWLSEVEQRVSAREAESQAEIDRVKKRFLELKQRYLQSQQQLKDVLQPKATSDPDNSEQQLAAPYQEIAQKLQDQVETLQQQLEKVNRENEQHRQHVGDDDVDMRAKLRELEESYVELQVETSRERAEIARERERLQRAKDELAAQGNSKQASDGDSRIMAMRQHLREIHEQEELRKSEGGGSLGKRISRLLSRTSQ